VLFLGVFTKPFLRKRNLVAKENFKIVYPNKSEAEINALVNESSRSMILSGIEIAAAWMFSKKKFDKIEFEWDGDSWEIYNKYIKDPKQNVIILGCHFHCMELIGRKVATLTPNFTVMFQPNSNKDVDDLMTGYRERNISKCLSNKKFVSVIKSIKRGNPMWYAPDQDFGLEPTGLDNSVFAPFFDIPCSTLTVTPWLGQKCNAVVIPMHYVRIECLKKYKIFVSEPLEYTGDDYHDAKLGNEYLEKAILGHPEQYLWQHRRFRTRPNGEPQIY
jgi:KDO2-lipid IV(A) lauroyltransferase